MPLIAVLTRVLRTFDTEAEGNEYFCCECVQKITEYDNLVRLSSQIESDLNEKFEHKPVKSTGLLDDDIFVDQNEIRDFLEFQSRLDLNCNRQISKNEIVDLTAATPSACNDGRPEKLAKATEFATVKNTRQTCNKQSAGTIALLDELKHFDDVPGLEIIAVVDHLNDGGDVQRVETIAVEIEQMEQLLSNVQQNEDDEFFESSAESDEYDVTDDSDSDSIGQIDDVAEESGQSTNNNEQTNVAEKRKTKTVRKRNSNKNRSPNITQSGPLSCDICGRTYKSKGALHIHMVKHSDQNPHGKENKCS